MVFVAVYWIAISIEVSAYMEILDMFRRIAEEAEERDHPSSCGQIDSTGWSGGEDFKEFFTYQVRTHSNEQE